MSSLKSIREKLSLYKKCPDNGLCVFSGIYYEKGKEIFEIHELIPPIPIKVSTYLCDKYFHVELIEKLYESYDDYGIVLIGGEDTTFYKFHGNYYTLVDKITVHRQKNQKKGGQSAPRFGRIREGQILEYTKLIIEKLIKNYVDGDLNKLNIIGLIIAGNDMKDKVVSDEMLPQIIKINIVKNMTVTDLNIIQIIANSSDVINNSCSNVDKYIDVFFESIRKGNSNIVYGVDETLQKLREKMVKILIVTLENYESMKCDIDKELSQSGCDLVIVNQFSKMYKSFKELSGIGGITWFDAVEFSCDSGGDYFQQRDIENLV